MKAKAGQSTDSTSVVCLSAELVPLLELAYHGMNARHQSAIDKEIKRGQDRTQAIFNEIIEQRLKMYAKGGELKLKGMLPALKVLDTKLNFNKGHK